MHTSDGFAVRRGAAVATTPQGLAASRVRLALRRRTRGRRVKVLRAVALRYNVSDLWYT